MNINNMVVLSGGVLGGLKEALLDTAESLYKGCLELFLKFANFSDILNSSYGILPEYVWDEQKQDMVFRSGVISPLIQTGQSFGAALALIFLIVTMVDIYTQEKMSIETFAKPFLQYLATVVLLLNCEKLVAFFWNFGVLFEKEMAATDISSIVTTVEVTLSEDVSVGLALGLIIGAIILLIISLLIGLIIRVCAYIANFSRMIEAGVRAIGFPIAMGISVDSSLRQGAMRYIKKFLAVALQGGIFVAISLIFTGVSVSVITNQAEKLKSFNDKKAESMSDEIATMFSWDEETQQYVYAIAEETNLTESLEFAFSADMTVVGIIYSILTCILPLIGLGLGSIVVLFKSGQICNDIVGA